MLSKGLPDHKNVVRPKPRFCAVVITTAKGRLSKTLVKNWLALFNHTHTHGAM